LQVVLPTGTYVTVEASSFQKGKFLNFYIRSSPRDWGMTEGLCGLYDGDKRNDLTKEVDAFNTMWR
jgi:hypothetical protein